VLQAGPPLFCSMPCIAVLGVNLPQRAFDDAVLHVLAEQGGIVSVPHWVSNGPRATIECMWHGLHTAQLSRPVALVSAPRTSPRSPFSDAPRMGGTDHYHQCGRGGLIDES
jgi:hypothetical protein